MTLLELLEMTFA